MKKLFTLLSILLFALATTVGAQTFMIDNFDSSAVDSLYVVSVEAPPSYIAQEDNHTDFVEGSGALDANYVIGEFHQWGSWGSLIYNTEEGEVMDWSISDSLSIWIKVRQAPTHPEWMVFRVHIADQPSQSVESEEYIYENAVVLDAASDWFELKIPLTERETDGTTVPNDEGFVLFPTSWGGGSYNNERLDRDKIVGYSIAAVVSGWDPENNLPADSVQVSYDNFTRFGTRAVPTVLFNGVILPSDFSTFAWGQSTLGVEEDAGIPDTLGNLTNALKWVQGNEWGNGWTGAGFNIGTPRNMLGGWRAGDSLKFDMKAEDGVGLLRIQFESGADGKVSYDFTPTTDNQWHSYSIALQDFAPAEGTTNFDTTAVTVAQIMAVESGVAGKVIYIDNWWTGNPVIDATPPNAPLPVVVDNADDYFNLVTWAIPEPNAFYTIFYSKDPITDLEADGVEWAGTVEETPPAVFDHAIYSPVSDSSVTYYYAVTAMDEAGNVSEPAVTDAAVTNTAKGRVTVSMNPPANFVADGTIDEWSGVTPIRIFPSEGAHIVTNTTVSSDNDLSVEAYLAVDDEYMYVAIDVTDDVVDYSASNSWEQDSPDLFFGAYNWHGTPHGSYQGGSEPDYHFRFNHDQVIIDNLGGHVLMADSAENYAWEEKFPAGYVVEAKFSWSALAAAGGHEVFTPVEGYRVPIDFSINDSDAPGVREGIMTLSPKNDDTSWQSPIYWTYTWIGNRMNPIVAINDDPNNRILSYELNQNYPNPFNPVTTITYSVQKQGPVQLDVFNTLGQKVATLVNQRQAAGSYTVNFDARNLSSGIYFYRLNAGEYTQIRKMILMK